MGNYCGQKREAKEDKGEKIKPKERIDQIFEKLFPPINKKEKEITMEESKYLIDYIQEKKNQIYLFEKLTTYRTVKYKIEKTAFIFVKGFFSYILNSKEKIDITIIENIVILSHTFYKGEQKHYLYKELKNEKYFQNLEVWEQLLDNLIKKNLEQFLDTGNKEKIVTSKKNLKEKKQELYLGGITHEITVMKNFGVDKKIMKDLYSYFTKKYEISDDYKNVLNNMIEGEDNK